MGAETVGTGGEEELVVGRVEVGAGPKDEAGSEEVDGSALVDGGALVVIGLIISTLVGSALELAAV